MATRNWANWSPPIRARVGRDQFAEFRVATLDQPLAQRLDPVQRGRLAARIGLVVLQRGAQRGQHLVVLAAQLLGQEPDLALVRDLRTDALGLERDGQQFLAQRQLVQARGRLLDQALGELAHGQGLALYLAAAGAEVVC